MGLHQAVEGFQEISQELEKQQKLRVIRESLKLLLIGFLVGRNINKKISELTVRKHQVLEDIEKYVCRDLEAIGNQVKEIENSGTYLIYTNKERCITLVKSLEANLTYLEESRALEEFVSTKKKELQSYCHQILDYNRKFIEERKKRYRTLWRVDQTLDFLDDEQQTAIVKDDKYNLVIAAAGSGKTEVLITRIKYLKERKPDGIIPNRILAIAYQNKDVKQIKQRLLHYEISNVNVRTFHGLGNAILKEAHGRYTPLIKEEERRLLIKDTYEKKLQAEPDYYETFLRYAKNLHDTQQEVDYRIKEDTLIHKQILPYTAINNESVRSRAEKEIYDFFLTNKLNGEPIKIEYEPIITGFSDQRERKPDFRLAKYDLFIEHWGLDEKGEVPLWLDKTTDEYKKGMWEKKEWCAKNDKLLVETFSYEYDEWNPHKFIELLRKRVIERLQTRYEGKFEFTPKPYDEVVEIAWGPYGDPVANDIFNFVKNAKTYGLTPEKIEERLRSEKWSHKQLAFGNLAVKVYDSYEENKRKQNKIDYEDMINEAIKELRNDENLYANYYDQILIDEYQDVTAQQVELIKTLLEHNPKCKLFCVGDDWQSIMGFAGSNVGLFVNFEKHFENPAKTEITTNYRSTRTIVDAGADLIKNNGSCQIQKATSSNWKSENKIKVFSLCHQKGFERQYYKQMAKHCVDRIAEYKQRNYAPKEILILSRYLRAFPRFAETLREVARENGINIAIDNPRAQGKVRFLTVHTSKGLEAKVVFILNVIKDTYGFPCEIEDPSIYAPSRKDYPPQSHAEEERRLFYVAMTRAKEDLVIYTWKRSKSKFLEEIKEQTVEELLPY